MNYLDVRQGPQAHRQRAPQHPAAGRVPVRDGEIVLACGNDAQFVKLCEVLGLPDLPKDERFTKNSARVRHQPILTPLLAEAFAKHGRLRARRCAGGRGRSLRPDQSVAGSVRGAAGQGTQHAAINVPHPLSGTVPLVNTPMRFAEHALDPTRAPPLLGEHTDEICANLAGQNHSRLLGVFPSPLRGGVRGGVQSLTHDAATPSPDPPPQGGREHTACASRRSHNP